VLVVDDHPIFRRGLRALLAQESWVGAIDEATSVAEAVRAVTEHPVDLVGLDVHLPDGEGTDHVGRLLRIRRGLRILMLTVDADEETVAAAVGEGAHGYLLKDDDPDDVVAALRTVAAGGFVLGPRVPHALRSRDAGVLAPPLDKITPRERELLVYLTAGRGNAEIAQRLGLAEKTVRNQMSCLFDKIGVNDRGTAALLARRSGLAPPAARPGWHRVHSLAP
jgi:DNA-binding NarL/FixJ family response regulator